MLLTGSAHADWDQAVAIVEDKSVVKVTVAAIGTEDGYRDADGAWARADRAVGRDGAVGGVELADGRARDAHLALLRPGGEARVVLVDGEGGDAVGPLLRVVTAMTMYHPGTPEW